MVVSAACLHWLRMEPKPPVLADTPETQADEGKKESPESNDAAFIPVNLSFKDLRYEVKASTGSDKLCLLSDVSGVFSAGRMCAL